MDAHGNNQLYEVKFSLKQFFSAKQPLGLNYSVYLRVGCTFTLKDSRSTFYNSLFFSQEREKEFVGGEQNVCVEKGRVTLFDGVFGSVLEKLLNWSSKY